MSLRAFALSLLLHGMLLGGALLWARGDRPGEPPLVVEAPLGGVFVREEADQQQQRHLHQHQHEQQQPDSDAGADADAPAAAVPSSPPGTPDGEAHPAGEIHPVYPPLSRKLGEEGEASFRLRVSAQGAVSEITLVKTSGHERLDTAAREALSGAVFRPAVTNGEPRDSEKTMTIEFRLR